VKHLGDITKISGYDAPVVDCVIGGSPCQDLSIAGKRAGLAGERSGLYMEQIRVIKEMREADAAQGRTDELVRPRYMVWENVPGAFSSNGGKDFAAVLEEAIRVAEPKAPPVSVPDKGWPTSGCLYDVDGRWSIAWRVFDAQFWGVPQRRRRIALVADFGGLSAPEILFVRKGVSGHSEPGKPKGKETAGAAGEGAAEPVYCLQGNGIDRADTAGCNEKGWREDVSYTLNTIDRPAVMGFAYKAGAKAGSVAAEKEMGPTLLSGRSDAAVYDCRGNGDGRIAPNMTGDHQNRVTDYTSIVLDDQGGNQMSVREDGKAPTLRAETHGNLPCIIEKPICTDVGLFNSLQDSAPPLLARTYKDPHIIYRRNHIVRRLTPLECERLQGYPDGWTDIGD
jgi:DNA (cytosine-5)-methyltransferase 1